MKDKEGKTQTDRETILQICKDFYEKLYETASPVPQNTWNSSQDKEELPSFEEQEVIKCLNEMSKNNAPGPDEITSELGGAPAISYLTKALNQILTLKEIPPSWHEAKIIILYKKGDPGDIANYRPISLLSHSCKIFTRLIQKRMERILDENQPRDQAGFRKAFSTTDHMHTLSHIIEKSNEFNLQLCLGFIDYVKAFDSVEHFAIFDALRKINIKENYIQILENIYKNATASEDTHRQSEIRTISY
ncbi:RNA-directed DNA polymerase (Reverse transcriptase) domain containing protein [Elysia marginata]|uniref:RNA-directed DNA polymerase (Reverse transcriptase) domain containing protein n=1 Tax=Elysia marginata TaxID=1093978 RepID=A0AAV4HED2_9GAST|nr:RNA-directed DNA polymerase (Reverse transcriptase) domain containing protein [Elysia marginata]